MLSNLYFDLECSFKWPPKVRFSHNDCWQDDLISQGSNWRRKNILKLLSISPHLLNFKTATSGLTIQYQMQSLCCVEQYFNRTVHLSTIHKFIWVLIKNIFFLQMTRWYLNHLDLFITRLFANTNPKHRQL